MSHKGTEELVMLNPWPHESEMKRTTSEAIQIRYTKKLDTIQAHYRYRKVQSKFTAHCMKLALETLQVCQRQRGIQCKLT